MTLDHYVICKSNMAPNMAANNSTYSTVLSNLMIFVSLVSFLGTMNTFRLNEYLYSVGNKIIEDMIGKSATNSSGQTELKPLGICRQ